MASRIQPYTIIGHWVAPEHATPGNPLASLQHAITAGAQMLHVDVRITRDEVFVIDYEAVRSLGGRETPLRERTNAEWQEHARETGAPLPTLDDVYTLARATGVGVMLDFKEPGTEGLLARSVRRSGIPYDRLLIAGAFDASRHILKALDPKIPLSLTLDILTTPVIDAKLLSQIDTDAVTIHHKLVTAPVVKVLHIRGIIVYTWTVNSVEEMYRVRNVCQVDGVITDMPELMRRAPQAPHAP